jgi:hypothetical protein
MEWLAPTGPILLVRCGTVVLSICAVGLAYVIYEYRRKQRVFIFEDSFAVERRFSFDVEYMRWTDVAKLYFLDRTTETNIRIYFVRVASSKAHRGKVRIVLVDGREIVITNRVRDFSAMATQFAPPNQGGPVGALHQVFDQRRNA